MWQLFSAIRIRDWWSSILIPVVSFYFIGLLYSRNIIVDDYLKNAVRLLLLSITTASFGFYLNEFTDVKDDLKAGKKNAVSMLSKPKAIVFLLFIIFVMGLSSLPFWREGKIIYLFLVQLLLFIVYSCPPIRLKRNPYIAVLLDSLYSGTLFFIIALFYSDVFLTPSILFLTIGFGVFRGLRNILYHVTKDIEVDKKAGQKTIAHIAHYQTLLTLQAILFFLEILCLLFVVYYASNITFAITLFGIMILLFKRNYYTHYEKKESNKERWLSEINTIYEVWLPIAALTGVLAIREWKAYLLSFVILILVFPSVLRFLHEIYILLANLYYLGYKLFYLFSDLYFIQIKPHFDIGKKWRKLMGRNGDI
ncbi:MAG: UbiA family prenyltransferase [Chitinophagales bacterium]|nr:UbiA family prenyltransferase [Chitinophagales bacterium]